MVEEITPQNKKEEQALSLLEQVKAERAAVEKANAEADLKIQRLTELQAGELLAGRSDAGKQDKKPEQESPLDYVKKMGMM